MHPEPESRNEGDLDRTADALVEFLRAVGAAELPHSGGRTLLDHLVETSKVVRRWKQPPWLQHAALIHSVYGTDVYRQQLLPSSTRTDLSKIAGARAERLAYLFSAVPRDLLFAGTHMWARDLPRRGPEGDIDQEPVTRDELDALVLLHMANLAEQARAADGAPGRWLVRLRDLAEALIGSEVIALPLFVAQLATLDDADETLARESYRAALSSEEGPEARASLLGLAAAACPVVAEPCVWQAHASWSRGELSSAKAWASCARKRLMELGAAWDKRLSFGEWLELANALETPPDHEAPRTAAEICDPRALLDATLHGGRRPSSRAGLPDLAEPPVPQPDAESGSERFHRYVESFSDGDGAALGAIYPELESQPWYDARDFPLAVYLETHFRAIQAEVLALDPSGFHRESERIKRSGDWDVAFLYERGRRHDEFCDACPVTARGIKAYPAMRTMTGLIYVSRMKGETHIAAHRGPTNLRIRCHLGIKVPDGDCAIRVGDQTRRWQEGRCLVFDDHFEHEAWNHTDEDRIVLIVDLWHPGLSAGEVRLLEGLHSYTYLHARKLGRYWSANAAAARRVTSA